MENASSPKLVPEKLFIICFSGFGVWPNARRIVVGIANVAKQPELEIALASRKVVYKCGCIVEYALIGNFSGMGWHATPCMNHTNLRGTVACPGELELRAERDFSAANIGE